VLEGTRRFLLRNFLDLDPDANATRTCSDQCRITKQIKRPNGMTMAVLPGSKGNLGTNT
jgi:hypothetical protein